MKKKNINYIVVITVFMLVVSCSVKKLTTNGVYVELSVQDFESLINNEDVNIIDVRTKGEYNKSHIRGAVNASYFSGKFSSLVVDYNLDKNKTTLIYCETQHRSSGAAKKLYKLGFKRIVDLKKGMRVWREKGLPFESE